jgi:hypothetical protein
MGVGASVASVIRASSDRAAVVAYSSWSHAPLIAKHNFVHPGAAADREMLEALARGDFEHWRRISNE